MRLTSFSYSTPRSSPPKHRRAFCRFRTMPLPVSYLLCTTTNPSGTASAHWLIFGPSAYFYFNFYSLFFSAPRSIFLPLGPYYQPFGLYSLPLGLFFGPSAYIFLAPRPFFGPSAHTISPSAYTLGPSAYIFGPSVYILAPWPTFRPLGPCYQPLGVYLWPLGLILGPILDQQSLVLSTQTLPYWRLRP